ncbi:hypothetical protein [Pseudonocardia lacus]|uniref:hypothetical protein n=1 Tax=Pseudonocardia lacus TaxID=2835865 RepID=UPI001BDCCABC|nr:hypothetical protein [Pseudonocardia lacus]
MPDQKLAGEGFLVDDFTASAVLASQLRRLLNLTALASMGGAFTTEATTLYLSLKGIWEVPDAALDKHKEVDDAVTHLDNFFTPLLDPSHFDLAVRSSQVFLRRYPGGSAVASQPPSDPTYIDHALRAFTNTLKELDEALAESFSAPYTSRLTNLVTGIVVLCSVPVWAVYHHFHGTAAYAVVSHQLASVLAIARTSVRTMYTELVRPRSTSEGNLSPSEEYLLTVVDDALYSMISARLGYLAQFERKTSALPSRIRFAAETLNNRIRATAFWVSGPSDEPFVTLGKPARSGPEAKAFPYHGVVLHEGGERLHARSFFALPGAWAVFEDFCRLVCQAGFTVTVTAVGNSNGGRHPPHSTHRSGLEFDVDWTFTSDPKDRVRNLARRRKKYGTGIFRDVERGQYFSLEELPGDTTPPTHIYIEALSALVVFQAAALSGLRRYLYVDVTNMILAADYLGWVVDRGLFAEVGRKANVPVAEGMGHFNHLHGEVPSPAVSRLSGDALTRIFRQALVRDGNDEFSSYYFRPPVDASPAVIARVLQFTERWMQRSAAGLPALLPVWLSAEEVSRRLGLEG